MTATWDAADFQLSERSDALRQTIRDQVVDVELALPKEPEQVAARVRLQEVGTTQICSVEAMPTVVTRTPRRARQDSEPSLFVTLQVGGTSMMVQHGREAVLRGGDLAVYATTDPYTLVLDQGVSNHFFRVPLLDLGLPADVVRNVSATTLSHSDPVVRLASDFLRGLADSELEGGTGPLGNATVELLRATILSKTPRSPDSLPLSADALAASVESYIDRHLRDPRLSAASIAHAHHVSVRHLYAVLSAADIGLGETIRRRRLEAARRDLIRRESAHLAIAAVGRKWCFPNAAHFSRIFREQFGLTPQEWRTRHSS